MTTFDKHGSLITVGCKVMDNINQRGTVIEIDNAGIVTWRNLNNCITVTMGSQLMKIL